MPVSQDFSHRKKARLRFPTWTVGVEVEGDAQQDAEDSAQDDSASVDTAQQVDAASDVDSAQDAGLASNPYIPPPGLSDLELASFILEMRDKPRSIQARPGFSDGVIVAADQMLASDAKQKFKTQALLAKFFYLHREARDDVDAQARLNNLVEEWEGDARKKVAAEIRFLQMERRVLAADDLDVADIPPLLKQLQQLFSETELNERHLRIASATVHAINLLPEEDREEHFQLTGDLFAKSEFRVLRNYGKRIAKSKSKTELVGKPLDLTGVTAAGNEFRWSEYRDQFVVVDFWATWCGPCRRAMPSLKSLQKRHAKQINVVGVNLDEDMDALAKYLEQADLPWENLVGETTKKLAEKYEVRGIPTLMLIDRGGKILTVSHSVDDVEAALKKQLTEAAP